jgi:hypothetical protein
MRKTKLTQTLIALALVAGAVHEAAGAPPKKGAGADKIPACWSELASTELDVRTRARALAIAVGGDLEDRATRAGAVQAHARQASLAAFTYVGYVYGIYLAWTDLYYGPHYFMDVCDANASSPACQSLGEALAAKNAVIDERAEKWDDENTALASVARSFTTAGNSPAVRTKATELASAVESLGSRRASCQATIVKKPVIDTGVVKAPIPEIDLGSIRVGDIELDKVKQGFAFATQKLAVITGDLPIVIWGADAKLKATMTDTIVVLRDGDGAYPLPTVRGPAPVSPSTPDPLAGNADHYDVVHFGGTFEIKVGKKKLRIDEMTIDGAPGDLRITGNPMGLGSCVQNLGAGSKIEGGKLHLSGKLKCGPLAGTGKIDIGGAISGQASATLFGHRFDFDLAWSRGELQGSTTWKGSSTDWQPVPGVDLEFRVGGPEVDLSLKGSTVTFTFDANKLELRSKSKQPDGTPWAYAYLDPPSQSFSADGKVAFTPPSLPTPSDAFKAMRDACIDGVKKTTPPGSARDAAIGVCNADHPSPPSIPSPPTSISVEVKVVIK